MNINDFADAVSEKVKKAITDAYTAGFQYAMSIGLDDSEFVDLGLPSGTKWGKACLGVTDVTPDGIFYSFEESQKYSIPTEEQVKELNEKCKLIYDDNGNTRVIGLNGNELLLRYNHVWDNVSKEDISFRIAHYNKFNGAMGFWIKSVNNDKPKFASLHTGNDSDKVFIVITEANTQLYKYQVLLVKNNCEIK